MVSGIGSKTGSLISSLRDNTNAVNKSNERLASGSRINKASDDAAGLAIALALAADAEVSEVASRNAYDGSSALQIADGASEQLGNIFTRMEELAVQSSNGVLSDTQRGALDQEFVALRQEAQRISETTSFNGKNLFQGESLDLQVGTDGSANSQISLDTLNADQVFSSGGLNSLSVGTQGNAQTAIDSIRGLIDQVSQARGEVGAVSSRLDISIQNNETQRAAYREAEGRIRDADVADEVSKRTSAQIREKSSVAILAQAGRLEANTVKALLT